MTYFYLLFWDKILGESKRRSDMVNKLQEVIAKEYELESLGGQAAAAAHSLGTPLATISVVSKELKKELGNNKEFSKDIDLLISQTKVWEILKQISKSNKKRQIFNLTNLENLLDEIIETFKETSSKQISLIIKEDLNKLKVQRSPELIYGLRNFIGNALKFSKSKVEIVLKSDNYNINIDINDDGPGFPEDIKEILENPILNLSRILQI